MPCCPLSGGEAGRADGRRLRGQPPGRGGGGGGGGLPPPWMSMRGPMRVRTMALHSMCQPGRPRPQGLSHDGSPSLPAFHSTKSEGERLRLSTPTRCPAPPSSCTSALAPRGGKQSQVLSDGRLVSPIVPHVGRYHDSSSPPSGKWQRDATDARQQQPRSRSRGSPIAPPDLLRL